MSASPESKNYRHVLLRRITHLIETPPISTETSLYRSELTGNYLIEQTIVGVNATTTSVVVLNPEAIKQIIPH